MQNYQSLKTTILKAKSSDYFLKFICKTLSKLTHSINFKYKVSFYALIGTTTKTTTIVNLHHLYKSFKTDKEKPTST